MQYPSFKKYPFARLLLFLIIGIITEWYVAIDLTTIVIFAGTLLTLSILFSLLSIEKKFRFRWLQGLFYLLLIASVGAVITFTSNIENSSEWYGRSYSNENAVYATLQEPLSEKTNSLKAEAYVHAVYSNGKWIATKGSILIYFDKDSLPGNLTYGSTIVFKKPIQNIANSGNPGCFDYKRYCLFHNITGQVYLKAEDFRITATNNGNWLFRSLYSLRDFTINTLQEYIPGSKEQGVAEALLIGYREDLDKDLVQAYSNTGVVHIIAISGLHIGMIYGALIFLFSFLKRNRATAIAKPIVILIIIWTFTLIAGAVPSIMRSAVMFSFIVLAESFKLKSNIYNTLAASAFCMLVFDPFVLWDVGFLLSYAAVISIITFQKYIYNWFFIKNKILNKIWQLSSVTLAAQILTLPIIIFYFHQFPVYFLITNLLVVPLSGLILAGEVILLCISPLVAAATVFGKVVESFLSVMNSFIEFMNRLPFSVIQNMQLSVMQAWLLYGCIIFCCTWLVRTWKTGCTISVFFASIFVASISVNNVLTASQQKLVVYNIPKRSAIDLIQGNKYSFTGDTEILQNNQLINYNIKPAHLFYHSYTNDAQNYLEPNKIMTINNHSVLLLNNDFEYAAPPAKIPVDIIIVSKNPKLHLSQLSMQFTCKQIVFDSSNPLWKIQRWKKDCDSLHLRFHSVPEQGAFVTDL